MSTDSSTSSPALLVPTPSTSTNVVGEALLASGDETESDSPPAVPWRTAADSRNIVYLGHTNWRAQHAPEVERPRLRRRIIVRRKRRVVHEIGITRDFFLIISLCFVLACLLIVLLRPIVLEIWWYIDDSY
ncbi:hypothetical protein DFH07DRAFT_965691 [Mycena maculata]|uniref:Uncharacterized protein n=1 Tax=Mycena maculata TaxID=230809 RepID=A0AAD7ICK1_9AGAR|nr:hypothetical protein DFH07DRAFT_965691 [Mycena maculata]